MADTLYFLTESLFDMKRKVCEFVQDKFGCLLLDTFLCVVAPHSGSVGGSSSCNILCADVHIISFILVLGVGPSESWTHLQLCWASSRIEWLMNCNREGAKKCFKPADNSPWEMEVLFLACQYGTL